MATFPQVIEADAEGKVKAAFDDIRNTLGVSTVGDVFLQLAVYPWFLQLAWRNLKPNASISCFHTVAQELEDMAISAAGGHRRRTQGDTSGPTNAHEARLDLDSKLLTATAALRYGTNGQLPKMLWMSPEEKQAFTPSRSDITPVDAPAPADESPRVVKLRQHAALAAESLPYRMEISASACRQSGLSEDQIDAVRAILAAAWNLIPRTLTAAAENSTQKSTPQPEPVAAA